MLHLKKNGGSILLLLPASILQDIMRFVCKEWNAIISDPLFIRAHLCHSLSSPGLGFLVQDMQLHDAMLKRAFYIHTNDATGYSWTELKLPFKVAILGSCNGLVLLQNAMIQKAMIRKELRVVNLVTKAEIRLPSLNLAGVHILCKPYTTLAFAPSSGQYKVVYVSFVSKDKQAAYVDPSAVEGLCAKLEVKVMVCTIAVDKTWRAIDSKGITMSNDVKMTLMSQPLSSAGGYICWFHKRHSYGLALDIDAETMYQFARPKDYLMNYHFTDSVKMDTGGVGMVHLQSPDKHWKVWELIEPKTGTWGRAMDLDAACMYSTIESHFNPCNFGFIVPLLFRLKTGELWLFCGVDDNYALVCYNWKTGNIWSPPIRWPRFLVIPHLHVNSLLSLKNL